MNHAIYRLLTLMDSNSSSSTSTGFTNLAEIEELYAQAPMDSLLRKFLVHLLVWERAGDV